MTHAAEPTLREALASYFAAAGFPPDGGYSARWVRLQAGRVPLFLPNIEARRRAVRYHDLHHLVTGYPTTWRGECQISAWEVAGGCAQYWVAWLLNLGALGIGLVLAPRPMFRAWCRGRRSRNLYREPYPPLLDQRVADVRAELGLALPPAAPGFADRATFAAWLAVAVLLWLLVLAAVALGVAAIVRLATR